MGYESDPLHSYPKLRNRPYYVKLITPLPLLFLCFIYCVLIPPSHQPTRPRHPLRLRAQCIDGVAGHSLYYGRLPPLGIHPNGLDSRVFHCLFYRWVLLLSSCPTFFRHPCDPSCHPMVKLHQDLEHIPGQHPDLSFI